MAQTPQKAKTSPGQVKSNWHGRMLSRNQLCVAAQHVGSCQVRRQRAATFFKLQPANPYYPSSKNRLAARLVSRHTKGVRRRSTAPEDQFSRTTLVEPRAPYPGPAAGKVQPPAQLIDTYILPVSPFVVALSPAPPGRRQRVPTALPRTSLHCVASFRSQRSELLLGPHSQTPAFEILG